MTPHDKAIIGRYVGSLTGLFEELFSIEQTALKHNKPEIIDELFVIMGDKSRIDQEILLKYTYPDIFDDKRWEEVINMPETGDPLPEEVVWFRHYDALQDMLYRPREDGLADLWIIVFYHMWRDLRQPDQTPDQQ